ncbi:MAG TPA: glycine betaine ABC transporter substrate-binding protein [Ktedonobacteraceae bacterium]|nr:glycine betaine ABC transporter substrate-binding protein [Ktedonobacteraceae bacterium]
MALLRRSLGAKFLLAFALIPLLILSACGSTTGSGSTPTPGATSAPSKVPITVASKLDLDGHLLGEMYVLLLRKAGYTVNPKLALGDNATLFSAIKSGAVDLYPEFTGTGLSLLGLKSAYNPDQDYQTVKTQYEQQFKITWLDQAPLNDGYALCTSQAESQKLGVTTLSELAPKVSTLTLATQSDGIPFFDALQNTYGFSTSKFKSVTKVAYAIGFAAVNSGSAQVTECYTTDGSVTTQKFIFLTDDKHGFTEFHPAPIVRDSVLQADPGIAAALNPMAPLMTTDVNVMLQQQVSAKHTAGESIAQAVQEVATSWLQSVHLL